jgi:hypothetical protein
MAAERVRGVGLRGDEPKRLALSDGSRLLLDGAGTDGSIVEWKRVGHCQARARKRLTVGQATDLAGDEYSSYVVRRTRVEAEWMRAVADWYRDQADRLDEGVARAEG